ncbi:hypothetical protein [Thiomicrorhabdus sp. Kp2]|nr:hypothetical protein [Thiomicrorhabdus sp. Kp2]
MSSTGMTVGVYESSLRAEGVAISQGQYNIRHGLSWIATSLRDSQ